LDKLDALDLEKYCTLVMVDEDLDGREPVSFSSSPDRGDDGSLSSLVSTVGSVSHERKLFDSDLYGDLESREVKSSVDVDLGSLFLLPLRRLRKLEDVEAVTRSLSSLLYKVELLSSVACLLCSLFFTDMVTNIRDIEDSYASSPTLVLFIYKEFTAI